MALYGDLTFDSRVRKEARTLAEAGYGVTIVCLAAGEARADLPANVTVVVRKPPQSAVLPGSANPFFVGRAGRLRGFGRRVAWVLSYVRGLRNWGRLAVEAAGPVDAWHAHDLTGFAAIAPHVQGRIRVYDSHELYLETGTAAVLPGVARRLLRSYERRLVGSAAGIITVNNEIAAEIVRRYRPRVDVTVVHNCPVLVTTPGSGSLIRDATGVPDSSPVVLYHGGLVAGRGIELLIEALRDERMKDVHLALMGYGALRDELERMAASAPWEGRLHVLDAVPPESLLAWVGSADIGAMVNPGATLNDVYSSPNKLFECLAAGTPVVASDFPTLHRIIMDNEGGPLGAVCDPGGVEAIVEAILALLRLGPLDRAALRARCRAAAEQTWNWDREAGKLLALYADLGLREAKHHSMHPERTGGA